MTKMFFIAAFLMANSAFAQVISVHDGLYDVSNPKLCAHQVTNDLAKKQIYLQGVSVPGKECGNTTVYKWSHEKDNAYLKTVDVLVNEDLLNRCAVVNGVKPCSPQELLYDKNDKLVIQLGDILKDGSLLRVLNPDAFAIGVIVIHMRNGKVLNSNYDQSGEYIFNKLQLKEIL